MGCWGVGEGGDDGFCRFCVFMRCVVWLGIYKRARVPRHIPPPFFFPPYHPPSILSPHSHSHSQKHSQPHAPSPTINPNTHPSSKATTPTPTPSSSTPPTPLSAHGGNTKKPRTRLQNGWLGRMAGRGSSVSFRLVGWFCIRGLPMGRRRGDRGVRTGMGEG